MRTIAEIKESIAVDFMRNDQVAKLYGFSPGADFSATFSKVSVESLLFYVVASAAWVTEALFDAHKSEVEARIEERIPHRPRWYRDKVLRFMADKELPDDSDTYDTDDMTDDQIAAARIVKHAVATEPEDASILIIKVAGEKDGRRSILSPEHELQLNAYIRAIKDAGVRFSLVNIEPETFGCEVDIYYNAMLSPEIVRDQCRQAVIAYIENLPFNGEYTNMALIDELQKIEGVRIPEFKDAYVIQTGVGAKVSINARYIPAAGYFAAGDIGLKMVAYE